MKPAAKRSARRRSRAGVGQTNWASTCHGLSHHRTYEVVGKQESWALRATVNAVLCVETRRLVAAPIVAFSLAILTSRHAHAYSDPISYADPVELGGGAGRWFTGSPADGFGCDACHVGAAGVDLTVLGLPSAGVVPGSSYEISLVWPSDVQHLALIAEFTDELRAGAGTLALPRPDATGEFERCSGEQQGFAASAIHAADHGRQLVSVVDCGARMVRFLWTAPTVVQERIWFNAGFVNSNDDAAPGGDGVTLVTLPLSAMGASGGTRTVAQGCSVVAPSRAGAGASAYGALALIAPALMRGLRTSRGRRYGDG
jgi:hypothetical protein